MPVLVDRELLRRKEELSWLDSIKVWSMIAFGIVNVVGQFLV
jgi:hypothetical protein